MNIYLKKGKEKALLNCHPWIFSGAIAKTSPNLENGQIVDVISFDNKFLARGTISLNSQIRVRVFSFKDEPINEEFFIRRIKSALKLRHAMGFDASMRILASEADMMPGFTLDKYNNTLVLQLTTAGAYFLRDEFTLALIKVFPKFNILEKSDSKVLSFEKLGANYKVIQGTEVASEIIDEKGVKIKVDLLKGHKSGFYLDQSYNRKFIAKYLQGQVLNCFAYTASFSLHGLQNGAKHITNIDVSDDALEVARINHELNDFDIKKSSFIKADVFSALREYDLNNTKFDAIILDPPKFISGKSNLTKGARGYQDINRLAMKILKPYGKLITFSCSGLMSEDLFRKIIADSAIEANRCAYFEHSLEQSPDHLMRSNFPQGRYLKGFVLTIV